jgi:hypothetical protein
LAVTTVVWLGLCCKLHVKPKSYSCSVFTCWTLYVRVVLYNLPDKHMHRVALSSRAGLCVCVGCTIICLHLLGSMCVGCTIPCVSSLMNASHDLQSCSTCCCSPVQPAYNFYCHGKEITAASHSLSLSTCCFPSPQQQLSYLVAYLLRSTHSCTGCPLLCRLLKVEARVQSPATFCDIHDGRSGIVTILSPSFFCFPLSIIFYHCFKSSIPSDALTQW